MDSTLDDSGLKLERDLDDILDGLFDPPILNKGIHNFSPAAKDLPSPPWITPAVLADASIDSTDGQEFNTAMNLLSTLSMV